jgi:hypothetical protein
MKNLHLNFWEEFCSSQIKLLLLTTFLNISCEVKEAAKNENDLVKIEIDLESFKEGEFSDLYDSIIYVLLKPDSINFLADPYKVKLYKDLIYVRDAFHNSIFVYDRKGNFQYRINSTGKGPNEFFTMDDFSIHKDTIWIKDGLLKKELAFSLTGKFLLEKANVLKRSMFYKGNNFNLYYLNNDPEFDFRILRKTAHKITPYIPRPDYLVNNLYSDPVGFQSNKDNEVYFNLPNDYRVLKFDSLGFLDTQYVFDFGIKNFKFEDRFKLGEGIDHFDYSEENGLVESITSFLVLDKNYIIYIRRNDQSKEYIIFNQEFSQSYKGKNLVNDLDFTPLNEMPWSSTGKEVVYLMNTSKFISMSNLNEIKNKPGLKSNLNHFLNENSSNLTEENFILAFAKVKLKFNN